LNSSLREQKEENICLTDETNNLQSKIDCLEKINANAEETLNVTSGKLHDCKFKLKRTASRENYALNKIKKYEENVKKGDCCEENKLRIAYLENELMDKDKKKSETWKRAYNTYKIFLMIITMKENLLFLTINQNSTRLN
jgi:chromosome segregation ATPase